MMKLSEQQAREAVDARGPCFAVVGTTRAGERLVSLHATATDAETAADQRRDAARSVRLHLPLTDVDYVVVARRLADARTELAEATAVARAAAARLAEAGVSESESHRQLGVDRMTIRSWLGKR